MKIKRILSAILATLTSVAIFSGCTSETTPSGNDTTTSSESASTDTDEEEPPAPVGTARLPENVEDYAIFKYTSTIPEGYEAQEESEVGKLYLNGKAKIVVMATNYKEDFQELSVFAESACANFKVQNMLYQSDTTFSDPVNTTVAGFDAVSYDYEVVAYEFVPDENATTAQTTKEGEETTTDPGVKTEIGRYKGRFVFFYSDEDVFYVQFESTEGDYAEQSPAFDDYLKTVQITKK